MTGEELAVREGRLLQALEERNLDVDWVLSASPETIQYLSGFRTTLYTRPIWAGFSLVPEEAPFLIVPSIDDKLAREPIWCPTPWEDVIAYPGKEGVPAHAYDALQRRLGGKKLRVGVELSHLTLSLMNQLKQTLPQAEWVDVTQALDQAKLVKTDYERELVRRATRIAEGAFQVAHRHLRAGVTERQTAAEMDYASLQAGADGFIYPTMVISGENILAPHAPPTDRKVLAGELVYVAHGPLVKGYCSDVVRTFLVGKPPSDGAHKLAVAALEAQQAFIDGIAPGVRIGDLQRRVVEVIGKHGLARNYTMAASGHGIGLTVREGPILSADNDGPFQPGMCLCVEPHLFDAQIGGFGNCDVVFVTSGGHDLLTTYRRELICVG